MAVTVNEHLSDTVAEPFWPDAPFDAERAIVRYDAPADELLIWFGEGQGMTIYDPSALADGDIAVAYSAETGEIIGVQGIPFLLGAVRRRPEWVVIAWGVLAGDLGRSTLVEALPGFVAEVAEAFAEHGIVGWSPEEFRTRPLAQAAGAAPRHG